MSHKSKVHELFGLMSNEVFAFIKESELAFSAYRTYIKDQLELKKSSYPQDNKIDNKTGLVVIRNNCSSPPRRKLSIDFQKIGSRSFYKCRG